MATLKMFTNEANTIWLPNIRRVETMTSFAVKGMNPHTFPWEAFAERKAKLEADNPALYGIIQQRIVTYENHSSLVRIGEENPQLLLIYVVLDVGDEVRAQNWIVVPGRNYLLENGKTIDRF